MVEHRTTRTPESSPRKKTGHSRPPRTTPIKWKDKKLSNHSNNNNGAAGDREPDGQSRNSDSSASLATTPSSVLINGSIPLIRDLSDLSGSYLNGNTAPRRTTAGSSSNHHHSSHGSHGVPIPGNVYSSDESTISHQRPWRQAKLLSSRAPMHPQPPTDTYDDTSFSSLTATVIATASHHVSSVLLDLSHDAEVEMVIKRPDAAGCRAPLLLLLMDPGRKVYELMQLWVDPSQDSVREIMLAIQQSLGDDWRQDYDGIFQVRNNHFSQLIHILNISKYDPQPYELWVAKPWSMSAKNTVAYSGQVLNHLKQIGVLSYQTSSGAASLSSFNSKKHMHHNPASSRRGATASAAALRTAEESILVLSREAQKRIYVPDGVLKHHHAFQFLTFAPPFEKLVRVDVLSGPVDTDDGSASQLSDSHYSLPMPSNSSSRDEDDIVNSRDDDRQAIVWRSSTAGSGGAMHAWNGQASNSPNRSNRSLDILARSSPDDSGAMHARDGQASNSPNRSNRSFEIPGSGAMHALDGQALDPPNRSSRAFEILTAPDSSDAIFVLPHRNVGSDTNSSGSINEEIVYENGDRPSDGRDDQRATLARLLSALTCRGKKQRHRPGVIKDHTAATYIESPSPMSERLWQVWEEASGAGDSVVSDSAPLLLDRESSEGNWRFSP